MPKNTSAAILRRWRELDLLLWRWELHIPKFAKRHGVSEKTVYRDIAAFKELGQHTQRLLWWGAGHAENRAEAARRDEKFYDGEVLMWGYVGPVVTPLFRHPEEEARRREMAKKRAEAKRQAEAKKQASGSSRPTKPTAR